MPRPDAAVAVRWLLWLRPFLIMGRMIWHIGTMGWGYDDWAETFYPPGLPKRRWLSHYAKHFDAVEIDSTFYGIPPRGRLRGWADAVPDNFRFTLKTPRLITHDQSPDRALEPMRMFLETVRELGEKLGVVLIQFGPAFSPAYHPALQVLVQSLPDDLPFAVELRDPNWWTDTTYDLLASRRIAWVMGDYDAQPLPLHVTSEFIYVRWIGTHNRFARHTQEQQDRSARLGWWLDALDAAAGQRAKRAWAFVNNDYAGYSIATANRLRALVGQPIKAPAPDGQGTLF